MRQPCLFTGQDRVEQRHADISGRIDDVPAKIAGLHNHQQPLVTLPATRANPPRKRWVQRDLRHRTVVGQGRVPARLTPAGLHCEPHPPEEGPPGGETCRDGPLSTGNLHPLGDLARRLFHARRDMEAARSGVSGSAFGSIPAE